MSTVSCTQSPLRSGWGFWSRSVLLIVASLKSGAVEIRRDMQSIAMPQSLSQLSFVIDVDGVRPAQTAAPSPLDSSSRDIVKLYTLPTFRSFERTLCQPMEALHLTVVFEFVRRTVAPSHLMSLIALSFFSRALISSASISSRREYQFSARP